MGMVGVSPVPSLGLSGIEELGQVSALVTGSR